MNPMQITKLEAEIDTLSAQKADIEAQMSADKAVRDQALMAELATRYDKINAELNAREDAWLALQE